MKSSDVRPTGVKLYFLSVTNRMPYKFGSQTLESFVCARACLTVEDRNGNVACGWGETPLSVQWVWPVSLSFRERQEALKQFVEKLAKAWPEFNCYGHPIEVSHTFQEKKLHVLLRDFNNNENPAGSPMPYLAALVCCSVLDIALHDAYGIRHNVPIYHTYNREYMNKDLSYFLSPAEDVRDIVNFENAFPSDYLKGAPDTDIFAWHTVGVKDPVHPQELTREEPDDGYPVLLPDWIDRDGLKCLKIKLSGEDEAWDYDRLVQVGKIALAKDVLWLTSDFNCNVRTPDYVNKILDRLMLAYPKIYGALLYVEQPFPYELEENRLDVHSVSARKPLFMDESAHDWRLVRLGRFHGWTGVALKSCKTQTGALLSLCWARAHGMTLMVQDLTNPMLAQLGHLQLAAHAGTIMGVESNSMQFCPEASLPEARIHPDAYTRTNGYVSVATAEGPGFGFRVDEINRELPEPDLAVGDT